MHGHGVNCCARAPPVSVVSQARVKLKKFLYLTRVAEGRCLHERNQASGVFCLAVAFGKAVVDCDFMKNGYETWAVAFETTSPTYKQAPHVIHTCYLLPPSHLSLTDHIVSSAALGLLRPCPLAHCRPHAWSSSRIRIFLRRGVPSSWCGVELPYSPPPFTPRWRRRGPIGEARCRSQRWAYLRWRWPVGKRGGSRRENCMLPADR